MLFEIYFSLIEYFCENMGYLFKYEIDRMKAVPYALAVGSLQYAQVCTRPDLAFVTGILGRYQSNLGIDN